MIWFLAPVASLIGAAGGWYVTKETVTDVLEANQQDTPLVNVGSQSNMQTSSVLLVVGVVVLAWYFFIRKGKK
ncbi:hypothetical protein P7F88_19355 [Vibrio hannami]|uniref:hypothetical protein n=1 Tax=Vibrio hannami TaxID=2717094 RepID=UPI00240F79C8|nr:hypothetical protein [Vibrio hannami]MDG3088114.1 hypothetical protein [Vibrio hannami]